MKKFLSIILASLMLIGTLSGCGGPADTATAPHSSDAAQPPAEIVWFIWGEQPAHYEEVMKAVNEKLLKDLNMTLNLQFVSPGDYNTKMQMAMAGGDDWDMCFTSNWVNNYVSAAGKGAYLQLTPEMLAENCPHIMQIIPERLWDGVKVNGGIYGIMNYQVMYDEAGFRFLKEDVDALKLDVDHIDNWDKLNEAIGKIAEAYPDKYATRGGGSIIIENILQERPISTILNLPVLTYNEETKKVDNYHFFERIEPALRSFKLWRDEGWQPTDAATLKDEDSMLRQGTIRSRYERKKPGVEGILKTITGSECVVPSLGNPVITTVSVQSTITSLNVNSKHPEKALQLLDYLFVNKEVSNMLFFGLEGLDYELVNGRVQTLPDCWISPQWQLGNQFNALLTVNDPENMWEDTIQGNEAAGYDVLFGFVPDRTPVETELATIEAIWMEYKDILYYGLDDYKTIIPEMMDKMEKAGLEKVTTEMQSQVDAFMAAQAQ